MVDFIRRFIVGALISILGIVAANLWFNWETKKRLSEKNERIAKPVATITSASNDVIRRRLGKVVWQPVYVPENLGVGDAVRTSSSPDSRAVIHFLKGGVEISLDEDSITVIDDVSSESLDGDHYSLSLIKGNALIQVAQDSKLDLKSGSQKITLSGTDVSASKQNDNTYELSVLKGPAIKATSEFKQNQFFTRLTPFQGTTVNILESANRSINFQWASVDPKPEMFDVYLEVGNSRKDLKRSTQSVVATKGQLNAQVAEGPVFWRLVAQNRKDPNEKLYSSVQKFTLNIQKAPRLAYPKNGETISLGANQKELVMRWVSDFKSHRIQIAKDSEFKNLVVPTAQMDGDYFNWTSLSEGEFYWRVIGDDLQLNKSLSSQINSFKIVTKLQLASPKILSPSDGQEVSFEQVKSQGLNFNWENVLGIQTYKLKISKVNETQEQIVDENQIIGTNNYLKKDLVPGSYILRLVSLDPQGKESTPPSVIKFTIETMPAISWLDGRTEEKQWYISKPLLKLNWKPLGKVKVSKFRVQVKDEENGKSLNSYSSKTESEVAVKADGVFTVFVEALGDKNQVLARSLSRVIKLAFKPLLPAPEFSARMPATVNASGDGSVEIQWNKVSGAKQYTAYLKSQDGKTVRKDKFSVTQGKYKKLNPGIYLISLASVDEFGREGQPGLDKPINVPDVSDVKAPKVKLNVK